MSIAQQIQKELEKARNYKSSENIYTQSAINERFVAGDQWKGINTLNLAPTTYNFIGQVAKTQVSSVMASQITINRNADNLSQENESVMKAAKVFTLADKKNWERLKMDSLNEDLLLDAFSCGMGATYWRWNEDIITGNTFLEKGDFVGEIVDSVSLYVSNPNDLDMQSQDWLLLVNRKTIAQVIEMCKANGVAEYDYSSISADTTNSAYGFDKEANTNDQVDVVTKMYKEKGQVMCVVVCKEVVIKKPYNTELTLYPVAYMNWDKRKRFIYGVSPITSVIANQKVANLQASMRHLHAQLIGLPKVIVNKDYVSNFTNAVGGISYVNTDANINVNNLISYIQPAQMSIDVDKSIDDSINRTKDLMGANQALLGEANPNNYSALMAQQKAASVPLESVKRRFYQYLEDVALIWLDFYKNKYKITRAIKDEEDDSVEEYVGTDFKDVYLNTKVDVGSSTPYNEMLQLQTLKEYFQLGIITDPKLIIESTPNELLANKTKILEMMEKIQEQQQGVQESGQSNEEMYKIMADWLEQQPVEVQQQVSKLPEQQQIEFIQRSMQQQ